MGCSSSTQTEGQANKNKPTPRGDAANGTKKTGESPEEDDPVESETIADQTDFEPAVEVQSEPDEMTENDIVPADESQTAAPEADETASLVDASPTAVETKPPSPAAPVAAVESSPPLETQSNVQSDVTVAPAQGKLTGHSEHREHRMERRGHENDDNNDDDGGEMAEAEDFEPPDTVDWGDIGGDDAGAGTMESAFSFD